jgi:hypothetical protein
VRDVPGVAWIVGGFVVLAFSLGLFYRSGPEVLPAVVSPWSQVDDVRERIRTRKIAIHAGESFDEASRTYRIRVRRLKDHEGTQPVAKYVVDIRPVLLPDVKGAWLGDGMEVALLDLQPSELFGLVRLVSFRKMDVKL